MDEKRMQGPLHRHHGGLIEAELETLSLGPDEVLDFSVNTNPYGPSPEVLRQIHSVNLERYPDPSALKARRAVAEVVGVDCDGVVVGNGACELLWSAARALVRPRDVVGIIEPTFSEFRAAAKTVGGQIHPFKAHEKSAFVVQLAQLITWAERRNARVIYLCNPNNPTGTYLTAAQITDIATSLPKTTLILDESFLSLSIFHNEHSIPLPANVVRVRSLTKMHTLPGLRVGYLLAAPKLARRLELHRPMWSTNAMAQSAVVAAFQQSAFESQSRKSLLEDANGMKSELEALGLTVFPSSTIYHLVRVGDAASLRSYLLEMDHILVRDCSSFQLPNFIRLGARPAKVRRLLLDALERVKAERPELLGFPAAAQGQQ